MTFPRADKDLLMFLASSSTAPSAPVLLTYSKKKPKSFIMSSVLEHELCSLCATELPAPLFTEFLVLWPFSWKSENSREWHYRKEIVGSTKAR